MATCKKCGKRTVWVDSRGFCEKCHDELYIAMMKRLAGDTSPDAGKLYIWEGPFRRVSCRLCGAALDIEPRTGYCKNCIAQLEKKAKREKEERMIERATFRLAGTTFHADAFERFADEADEWHRTLAQVVKDDDADVELRKYEWPDMPAKIEPEPDNPEDPDALAVTVAGEVIGYIKREDQAQARDLLPRIIKATAMMHGGPTKMATWDDERDQYVFVKDEAPFYATLIIEAKRL